MSDTAVDEELPQFHIVVRRPNGSGPLAPYRMTLAVVFAMFIAGRQLWVAATSGLNYDIALLHAVAAGFFIWVLSGIVNNILANSRPASSPTKRP